MDKLQSHVTQPSWRKPAGALLILAIIALWALMVIALSGWIGSWPGWVQAIAYLFLGLVWITPMKPLLRWMEGGRPR